MDIKELLELQELLQFDAFGESPRRYEGEEFITYVRHNVLAAHTELSEFLQTVNWKWYGARAEQEDRRPTGDVRDKAVEELVDVLHFYVNLLIALHVDEEELEHVYREKRRMNQRRQAAL